jgi:DNA-binding transcriptional ArsR family regulator
MDSEKDIPISSNKIVLKESNSNSSSAGYIKDTSKFDQSAENVNPEYLIKRTSKLVEAVFLVSDIFEDSNVLKAELRSDALLALSLMYGYLEEGSVRNGTILTHTLGKLSTLLRTSSLLSLVSPSHATLLVSACTDIGQKINIGRDLGLVRDILDTSNYVLNEKDSGSSVPKKDISNKGRIYISDNVEPIFEVSSKKTPESVTSGAGVKSSERRDPIMSLIREKQRVTVRDIQSVVKDVSLKTLQRELIALVAEGVLKKEGERRWSVYMLRTNGNGNGNGNGVHSTSSSI